jgi:uncharacterized phage-associated protein
MEKKKDQQLSQVLHVTRLVFFLKASFLARVKNPLYKKMLKDYLIN